MDPIRNAKIGLFQAGLLFLVFSLLFFALWITPLGTTGAVDFLQYWSSAKLLFAGQNPYDPELLLALQKEALPIKELPILLWNPPTIFPFTIFLAGLSFSAGVKFWMLGLLVSFFGAFLAVSMSLDLRRFSAPLILFLLSFYPFFELLGWGQSSHIHLLGLSLFLLLVKRSGGSITSNFWAGAALSLSLVKPHLLLLVYLTLFSWSLKRREFSTVAGVFFGGIALLIPSIILQPRILEFYFAAASSPPLYWQTPTLGSWLQGALNLNDSWERFFPTALAILGLLYFEIKERDSYDRDRLFFLVPLSLVTSAYGWIYDQVLLLPSIIWWLTSSQKKKSWKVYLPVVANLLLLFTPKAYGQHTAVWYPALIFTICYLTYRQANSEKSGARAVQ